MRSGKAGQAALLAALTALSMPAFGGDLNVVVGGRSYHVESSHDWNEHHSGVGVEYYFDSDSRWRWVAMANGFRDSNDSMSYMTGIGLHRRIVASDRLGGVFVDAGLNAFVMTREDVHDNRPFPGLLPSVTVGNRYGGLNLTYLPARAVQEVLQADIVDPTIRGIFFVQFKLGLQTLLPD